MGTTPDAWDGDGVWLKTALHTHTSDTDGELPPRAVAEHYEWAGFDVLAITDHWTLTSVPSSEHLLVITGAELAVDPLGNGRYTEILAIGIDELPDDPGGDRAYWERIDNYDFKTFPDLSTAAAFITGQGGAAFVAHPYWSGLPPEVILGRRGPHGPGAVQRELRTRNGPRGFLLPLGPGARGRPVSLRDRHRRQSLPAVRHRRRVDHGARGGSFARRRAGFVAAGRTYASNGPVLHDVRRDGDRIEVRCSPCVSVGVQTRYQEGWAVRADHRGRQEGARILQRSDAGSVVHAEFRPAIEDLPFVRVVATDAEGRRAWTNPL